MIDASDAFHRSDITVVRRLPLVFETHDGLQLRTTMTKTKVKTIKREQLAKFAYINSSKMPGEVLRVHRSCAG